MSTKFDPYEPKKPPSFILAPEFELVTLLVDLDLSEIVGPVTTMTNDHTEPD